MFYKFILHVIPVKIFIQFVYFPSLNIMKICFFQSLKAAMSSHKVAYPDQPTLKAEKVAAATPLPTTRGKTSMSSDVRDVAATVDPPDGPSCSSSTEAAEDTDEQLTENAQEDQVKCNSCILLKQNNRVLKNRIDTARTSKKTEGRKVEVC